MLGKLFADFAVERQALYRQEVLLAGMPGLVRIKQTDIALRKSRIYSVPGRVADTVGKNYCQLLIIIVFPSRLGGEGARTFSYTELTLI
jgi:hypothetical protein